MCATRAFRWAYVRGHHWLFFSPQFVCFAFFFFFCSRDDAVSSDRRNSYPRARCSLLCEPSLFLGHLSELGETSKIQKRRKTARNNAYVPYGESSIPWNWHNKLLELLWDNWYNIYYWVFWFSKTHSCFETAGRMAGRPRCSRPWIRPSCCGWCIVRRCAGAGRPSTRCWWSSSRGPAGTRVLRAVAWTAGRLSWSTWSCSACRRSLWPADSGSLSGTSRTPPSTPATSPSN